MSEDEQVELLSSDGMLVKRPILVGKDSVLVGFKEEEGKYIIIGENYGIINNWIVFNFNGPSYSCT